jgi:hypothetical protein
VGKQSLRPSTYKKKFILGFKGIRIWPFNPKAMDGKINFNIMYTLVNQNREEKYDDYHSNEEDGEMQ